ncbi:transglycosylase family protein [Kribbia dieselivorans]|uniref:transglycosylase family protein n=1 Tax=Kribbia dieselivorans TaxID=331526 RepID=UPI0008393B63|nr:transglycosylase family protein [Kribbia dieselivorans]
MSYSPKHAQPKAGITRGRVAGVAVAGAATVAGGLLVAPSSANAATVWDRVAACESGGNWRINTGNGFYGGLQFHPRTWLGYGGGRYAAYAHQATKAQQIAIAQKVLQAQGPGAWPVCSRRAGLTRSNGMVGGTTATASRSATRTYTAGRLVVDGVRGPATNRGIEKWVGTYQNGVLGTSDIRALQRKLGVAQTGYLNTTTVKALQRRVGSSADGIWGPNTTRALQSYLNRVVY